MKATPVKHQSAVTVRRVANGWIVEPYIGQHMCSSLDDINVFREWAEASKYISAVTLVKAVTP